jgi:hypothetical protein
MESTRQSGETQAHLIATWMWRYRGALRGLRNQHMLSAGARLQFDLSVISNVKVCKF